MICVGKGTLLLAPVLDLFPPSAIVATHSGHPLSCVAASENLEVIDDKRLVEHAAAVEIVVKGRLGELQKKFREITGDFRGRGLMHAVYINDPVTGEASISLARDLTWETVRCDLMMFYTNRPTLSLLESVRSQHGPFLRRF